MSAFDPGEKFSPGDLVMLVQPYCKLPPGVVGEVEKRCINCSVLASFASGTPVIMYHVRFSPGLHSVPKSMLKKIGDDPDAGELRETERPRDAVSA